MGEKRGLRLRRRKIIRIERMDDEKEGRIKERSARHSQMGIEREESTELEPKLERQKGDDQCGMNGFEAEFGGTTNRQCNEEILMEGNGEYRLAVKKRCDRLSDAQRCVRRKAELTFSQGKKELKDYRRRWDMRVNSGQKNVVQSIMENLWDDDGVESDTFIWRPP